MTVSTDSICPECGSQNVSQIPTQIPGVFMHLKHCGCCGVITKIKEKL